MTEQQIAARKARIYLIAAVGVAAFLANYVVAYLKVGNAALMLLLTAVFIGCVFIAATMTWRLKKEVAPK